MTRSEERNWRAAVWGTSLLAVVVIKIGEGGFGPVNVVVAVLGEEFVFVCCGERELLMLLLSLSLLVLLLLSF